MNQGRIWCVVSPNVGLPLLLGSVAVTSLIVHAAVMTHTTWMSSYWAGSKGRVAMEGNAPPVATVTPKEGSAFSMTVTPVPATGGASPASFVITVTPAAPAPSTVATANADPAGPNPVSHTADSGVAHIPITN